MVVIADNSQENQLDYQDYILPAHLFIPFALILLVKTLNWRKRTGTDAFTASSETQYREVFWRAHISRKIKAALPLASFLARQICELKYVLTIFLLYRANPTACKGSACSNKQRSSLGRRGGERYVNGSISDAGTIQAGNLHLTSDHSVSILVPCSAKG
jgi:hypothetical protein